MFIQLYVELFGCKNRKLYICENYELKEYG